MTEVRGSVFLRIGEATHGGSVITPACLAAALGVPISKLSHMHVQQLTIDQYSNPGQLPVSIELQGKLAERFNRIVDSEIAEARTFALLMPTTSTTPYSTTAAAPTHEVDIISRSESGVVVRADSALARTIVARRDFHANATAAVNDDTVRATDKEAAAALAQLWRDGEHLDLSAGIPFRAIQIGSTAPIKATFVMLGIHAVVTKAPAKPTLQVPEDVSSDDLPTPQASPAPVRNDTPSPPANEIKLSDSQII